MLQYLGYYVGCYIKLNNGEHTCSCYEILKQTCSPIFRVDYMVPSDGSTLCIFILAYFDRLIPAFHDLSCLCPLSNSYQNNKQQSNKKTLNQTNLSNLHLSTSIYIYLHLSTSIYIYLHLSTYLPLSLPVYTSQGMEGWDLNNPRSNHPNDLPGTIRILPPQIRSSGIDT